MIFYLYFFALFTNPEAQICHDILFAFFAFFALFALVTNPEAQICHDILFAFFCTFWTFHVDVWCGVVDWDVWCGIAGWWGTGVDRGNSYKKNKINKIMVKNIFLITRAVLLLFCYSVILSFCYSIILKLYKLFLLFYIYIFFFLSLVFID